MLRINKILPFVVCFLGIVWIVGESCSPNQNGLNELEQSKIETGMVEIGFNYYISGVPKNRIKRSDLSIAYSADSAFRGQFFDSANVSDSVNMYRFILNPGIYYFRASIVCMCYGDSCKYAGFTGQYAQRQTASKFQIIKGEVTRVHTQFQ